MTTSGTTAFNPTVASIIEEAAERAGYEIRSGYDFRTALRSLNYLGLEFGNRGLNLWTLTSALLPLVAGTSTYTLPTNLIDLIDCVWTQNPGQTTQVDVAMEPYTVAQWARITNKTAPGIPIVYYVQRLTTGPVLNIYFTPDQPYYVTYYALRQMQDAGGATNTYDVPPRFVPAVVAGLAYRLAAKKPSLASRVIPLKAAFDEEFQLAADEDRDRSSFWFVPDTGVGRW